jgi:hypothetical protein
MIIVERPGHQMPKRRIANDNGANTQLFAGHSCHWQLPIYKFTSIGFAWLVLRKVYKSMIDF